MSSQNFVLPALWLIVLIVGLPQLSETVYTPSLPDIAHALQTSDAMVEYTLTIYLFAFAIGTLFWGKISDVFGRKPCLILGFLIFVLGCIGCYYSPSIEWLMFSRFVQAFGGSTGSVLGQAICRDAFHGPALGKVYSSVGASLAIFPAIGPVIGGFIAQDFEWAHVFSFLMICGIITLIFVIFYLPETHHKDNRQPVSIMHVAKLLATDRNVLACGLFVGACNGIGFSYFAEGSFYLIELLGLSPSQYGLTFIAIAASAMVGGMVSKKLHNHHSSSTILGYGLGVIFVGSLVFSGIILLHPYLMLTKTALVFVTIVSQMTIMFGMAMTNSNALAMALVDYKWCIGTASSLFGFFYYVLVSLATLGMGSLHNDTLYPMPLYFLGLSIFMLLVRRFVKVS